MHLKAISGLYWIGFHPTQKPPSQRRLGCSELKDILTFADCGLLGQQLARRKVGVKLQIWCFSLFTPTKFLDPKYFWKKIHKMPKKKPLWNCRSPLNTWLLLSQLASEESGGVELQSWVQERALGSFHWSANWLLSDSIFPLVFVFLVDTFIQKRHILDYLTL